MSRSQLHDICPNPLSSDCIEEGLELCEQATQVVGWYAHGPEIQDCATVRGPFGRWFNVEEIVGYKKHVSCAYDDVKFAAHAMNNYRDALLQIKTLQEEINIIKEGQDLGPLLEEFGCGYYYQK